MPTAKALRDLARPAAIALITGAFTFHAVASADPQTPETADDPTSENPTLRGN